jgi:hypothetical protein
MNRVDFQALADTFLDEAQTLLTQGKPGGAYYLAGYAVECALKACIAKLTAQYDFPRDRKFVESCYTHDLERLIQAAGLAADLKRDSLTDPDLDASWTLVKNWNESSRYERKTGTEAKDIIQAITDPKHGVLPWLKARW